MGFKLHTLSVLLIAALLSPFSTGCSKSSGTTALSVDSTDGVLSVSGCTATSSGSSWVPSVANANAANHNANVVVNTTTVTKPNSTLSGLADSINGREVTVTFTVPADLGINGSITLTAQVTGYPSGIDNTAYPVLTSLSDGTNEYINLPRDGSGNPSCGGGFYTCSGGSCTSNAACQTVGYPSAYTDFTHYYQHQIPNWGYESVNRFPTCAWAQGNAAAYNASTPACAFNTYLAGNAGHLPVGLYTAKYFLLTDGYANLSGKKATLNVTVTERSDTVDAVVGGAVDVNVVLVGSKNIADSHTAAGQRNLDTLFFSFGNYLNTASTAIQVGNINVYELNCTQGGEALATISSDQLGTLLKYGSAAIGNATEGKALNIFLISDFSDSSSILGISGAIGGPPLNGLETSGLAFATFNMLQLFNSGCAADPCPITSQDSDFYEMGNTIAHEAGHFLGLG